MQTNERVGNKIIGLHGSYHRHNFGDILLMALYTKAIKAYVPNSQVSLPFATEETRKIIGADLNGVNTLLNANSLVYGGGGYFGEPSHNKLRWGYRNIIRHVPPAKIISSKRKEYAIIGVGVGPISNRLARNMLIGVCHKASVLAVRDEESKSYLIDYGIDPDKIKVTADVVISLKSDDIPVYALKEAKRIISNSKRAKKVAVHIQNFEYPETIKIVKEEVVEFSKRNDDVEILLLSDGFKIPRASYEINRELPQESSIVQYSDPWIFTALLGLLDLVVTTKLHVGITSTALGRPVLSFPVHSKTPRFFNQINASDRCIPLTSLKKGQVLEQLNLYIDKTKESYYPPQKVIDSSKSNFDLLKMFLNKN
ncbi:polysaccharide pyruvyl transferase family protein [Cohnella sp. JJ-181]|uniref:polysaccharide pyruvyl transferase family protein n=1 Tax=Cohnella rhizoplanae TaxID=2974897 RepID=UPI0022FF7B28|nr:polysaccharide pyruvyl transferase family protein [Cohnella sp. JJ-181]CAI6087750.1 hypothetical protein COHCIP112018_05681 [Cohnella sp. JJ-181]